MEKRKRSLEIDALKGFAIFLVILGHAVIYYPIDLHNDILGNIIYSFCISVHMPLFFMISGYCYNYNNDYKRYIKKKIDRILIPYICFNFIDMIFRALLTNAVNRPRGLRESLKRIILYGGEYWFLYVLFLIFLIFPLFSTNNLWNKKGVKIVILGVLFLISSIDIEKELFQISGLCCYLFWFTLGFFMKQWDVEYLIRKIRSVSSGWLVVLFSIWVTMLYELEYTFLGKKSIISFVGVVTIVLLLKYDFFISFFSKYGFFSLQLYLLNGFFLVVSRTIICNYFKCEDAILIIMFNVLFDFFFSYFAIKNVFSKIVLFNKIMGM